MGHLLRHEGLVGIIIKGTVEGENVRGRPCRSYIEQLKKDADAQTYQDLKRKALDRDGWRTLCQGMLQTNPRIVT